MNRKKSVPGNMLLFVMIFGTVSFVLVIFGLLGYAFGEHRASMETYKRDVAFHLSEAGINYYRWHLAHNPIDFVDGVGEHIVRDRLNNSVGSFNLVVTPPEPSSSVVSIASTGSVGSQRNQRTLQVRVGFESFTDYAFLQNGNMHFSFTTHVSGALHSNGGIRFDGTSDSWVRSAKDRYQYENQTHNGVWGAGGPKYYWQFPVPAVDFGGVTADLADMRTAAQQNGVHLLSSGNEGWLIVFRDTVYDLYRVTSRDCYYGDGRWRRRFGQWYWEGTTYCFDKGNTAFVRTEPIPDSGLFFVEDHLWVEGVVDGRVVVGVGTFPAQGAYKELIISHNLVHKNPGGDDVIGLIAQGDIIVPYEAPSTMNIHAAALSQNGKIYTPYYNEAEQSGALKDSLTFFGSQISYQTGGWKYVNGWGHVISGYVTTNHVHDGNLKYFSPPGFPLGSTYELISWEEIK